jgi:hypothetical protein
MSLKVEDLLYALDNENNTGVAGLTASKIKQEKNDVLQKLQLSKEELKDFHMRLADYRYVDEVSSLQEGRYIRWIPLNVETAEIKLTKGAFMVRTTLNDDGVILICRNTQRQSVVVKFDNVLIFQKLSDQEQILIKALTLLDKK